MKIFAIYVIIGIIEWILVYFQIKVIQIKEEREYNIRFKSENTPLENWFSFIKSLIIMMVPILRTIITFAVLFSEEVQNVIIEKLHEYPTVSEK